MKILELTNYSAGICGVWNRVKQESILLSNKGYEVKIFSSNHTKGSNETAHKEEKIEKIKIKRFPAKKLGGESFLKWNFTNEAIKYNPDIIIAHSYRQLHTTQALKVAKKTKSRVFLVTHAPFERSETRDMKSKIAVKFYDSIISQRTLKKFNSIIAITKWEVPYLLRLGIKKEKISYIPNGIPDEFFSTRKFNEENKILFLGRISPIKDLESLIKALKFTKNKNLKLCITGPYERDHISNLKKLITEINLEKRISFSEPIYDIRKKIEKIDSYKIFILPSKSEGMPQSLIEAMARKRIVISSDNQGAMDLIEDKKNGYLFKKGDYKDLAEKINNSQKSSNKLRENARKSVEKFSWSNVISDLDNLIKNTLKNKPNQKSK